MDVQLERFTPTEDRVAIRVEKHTDEVIGGVFVPAIGDKRPNRGLILAVGPGKRYEDGTVVPVEVQVGDRVMFPKYATIPPITIEGQDVMILRESDLIALVDDDDVDGDDA